MAERASVSQLHYELIRGLADRGVCPSNAELAQNLGESVTGIEHLLLELSGIHGVVLHPHVCEPWVIHPFSLTPTINWVESARRGWWAPCVWCALGVATVVGGLVQIHSRFEGEADSFTFAAIDGQVASRDEVWVHFAIPPCKAWQNVHEHCSLVLPFRTPERILDWCGRHRLPYGQAVALQQVAELARLWYGTHGKTLWHKWTIREAQEIFEKVGLSSPFWDLGAKQGNF